MESEKKLLEEIENVKKEIQKSNSYKFKNDKTKYLKKLIKELKYYRKHFYKGGK